MRATDNFGECVLKALGVDTNKIKISDISIHAPAGRIPHIHLTIIAVSMGEPVSEGIETYELRKVPKSRKKLYLSEEGFKRVFIPDQIRAEK